MAMTMNGEVQLAATPETVWEKLNDPATLKACIPGCEQLDKLSDTEMQAVATVKIGPVKAKFKGKVTLSDLDPPHGYKISGQGDGGVAGFAKGGATVKLTPKDGGTLLTYDVDAQIGGKLAQLGQRLVNGAAKKVADDFFANFAAAVNPKSRLKRLVRRNNRRTITSIAWLRSRTRMPASVGAEISSRCRVVGTKAGCAIIGADFVSTSGHHLPVAVVFRRAVRLSRDAAVIGVAARGILLRESRKRGHGACKR